MLRALSVTFLFTLKASSWVYKIIIGSTKDAAVDMLSFFFHSQIFVSSSQYFDGKTNKLKNKHTHKIAAKFYAFLGILSNYWRWLMAIKLNPNQAEENLLFSKHFPINEWLQNPFTDDFEHWDKCLIFLYINYYYIMSKIPLRLRKK